MTQDDQRSLALFNEMKVNLICPDRAMRSSAAGGLRERQTRLADGANRRHTKSTDEFTSQHWRFSCLTAPRDKNRELNIEVYAGVHDRSGPSLAGLAVANIHDSRFSADRRA